MLLRALATGEFRPVGATRSRTVDVRVVSATNRPLNQLVMTNQFRYDLLFRLRQFHLAVPPLRDRGDDWRLIVDYWLARLAAQVRGRQADVRRRAAHARAATSGPATSGS